MSKQIQAMAVVRDLRSLADSIEKLFQDDAPVAVAVPDKPAPPIPDAETEEESHQLTLVELRAMIAEISTPENRPKIKAVLNQFGVAKLTELRPDQYQAVILEVSKACLT